MKLKVEVIALNLKNNKVANAGQVIDSNQLPVPENVKQLIKDGYVSKVKSSDKDDSDKETKSEKKARKKAEKKAKKTDKSNIKDEDGFSLDDKSVAELKEFAKSNNIELTKTLKADIKSEILAELVNRDDENKKPNKVNSKSTEEE